MVSFRNSPDHLALMGLQPLPPMPKPSDSPDNLAGLVANSTADESNAGPSIEAGPSSACFALPGETLIHPDPDNDLPSLDHLDIFELPDNVDPKILNGLGFGNFTSRNDTCHPDTPARYLEIYGLTPKEFEEDEQAKGVFGNIKAAPEFLKAVGVKKLTDAGRILVRFDSISDARAARRRLLTLLENANYAWHVRYIPAVAFIFGIACPFCPLFMKRYGRSYEEAMVRMLVMVQDIDLKTSIPEALPKFRNAIVTHLEREFGDVIAIEFVEYREKHLLIHIEFDSVLASDKCAMSIKGQGLVVHMEPYVLGNFGVLRLYASFWNNEQDPNMWVDQSVCWCDYPDVSPIDLDRIENGEDLRTTVMLRNIPNKMGFFELFRFLIQVANGRFDFLYVRVDFANQCNVGYAFINFTEPVYIKLLHDAVVGYRWAIHNSEKISSMSYATIQGPDALVERFRNSGVREQWPPFRPKLIDIAPRGPNRLWDIPFPSANNPGKLQRSLDNARNVGLYPPNRDRHIRQQRGSRPHQTIGTIVRNNGVINLLDPTQSRNGVTHFPVMGNVMSSGAVQPFGQVVNTWTPQGFVAFHALPTAPLPPAAFPSAARLLHLRRQ